jgi:multidrug efflux pump subunit AcrA (membrane-fusion protein)
VLESEKGAQVWIVDPGSRTVQAQPVTVVAKAGDIVTVDGLKPGTRVVTAGVHSLAEGQKIRFLKGAAQ